LRLSLKARLERAWMPALSLSMMNQASACESPKKGLRSRSRSSVLALEFVLAQSHTRVWRKERRERVSKERTKNVEQTQQGGDGERGQE
jgi:hypothetical protein